MQIIDVQLQQFCIKFSLFPSLHPLIPIPQDNMLFCDSCDRGFHMECCDPPLSRMPKGDLKNLVHSNTYIFGLVLSDQNLLSKLFYFFFSMTNSMISFISKAVLFVIIWGVSSSGKQSTSARSWPDEFTV